MAWVTPTTRVDGEFITAAIWNIAVNNDIEMHSHQISGAFLDKNAGQNVNSGDDVSWPVTTLDNDSYVSGNTFVAPYDGTYLVTVYLVSNGATALTLRLNDASTLVDYGSPTTLVSTGIVSLSAADNIRIRVGTDTRTIAAGAFFAIKLMSKT